MTLPDLISSKEVKFKKILSINQDLKILVDKSIRGNKKLKLKVRTKSINKFIESENSHFNKSISHV